MKYLFTHSVTIIADSRDEAIQFAGKVCGNDPRILDALEKQSLYHCESVDDQGIYALTTYSVKKAGEIYGQG